MTKDEALKLALETLESSRVFVMSREMIKQPEGADWYDNRITAIKEALAQPERDPWREAVAQPERDPWREAVAQPEERNFCPRCGKRTADLTTVHTCTPPIAADPKAFHGLPQGSVSTPNAGGKCVTAGETAPIKEIDPNAWAFDRGLEST